MQFYYVYCMLISLYLMHSYTCIVLIYRVYRIFFNVLFEVCIYLSTFVNHKRMPVIDFVNGVKLLVYNGDHRPPHIHARYNEYEVIVSIVSKEIVAGDIPGKQLKSVLDWLAVNSDYALTVFYELNPNLK